MSTSALRGDIRKHGFTLIEVIVTMGIASVMMLGLMQFASTQLRSQANIRSQAQMTDLGDQIRLKLEVAQRLRGQHRFGPELVAKNSWQGTPLVFESSDIAGNRWYHLNLSPAQLARLRIPNPYSSQPAAIMAVPDTTPRPEDFVVKVHDPVASKSFNMIDLSKISIRAKWSAGTPGTVLDAFMSMGADKALERNPASGGSRNNIGAVQMQDQLPLHFQLGVVVDGGGNPVQVQSDPVLAGDPPPPGGGGSSSGGGSSGGGGGGGGGQGGLGNPALWGYYVSDVVNGNPSYRIFGTNNWMAVPSSNVNYCGSGVTEEWGQDHGWQLVCPDDHPVVVGIRQEIYTDSVKVTPVLICGRLQDADQVAVRKDAPRTLITGVAGDHNGDISIWGPPMTWTLGCLPGQTVIGLGQTGGMPQLQCIDGNGTRVSKILANTSGFNPNPNWRWGNGHGWVGECPLGTRFAGIAQPYVCNFQLSILCRGPLNTITAPQGLVGSP